MDQELFQKLYNASFSDQYKVIAGVYERCEVKFLPEKFAELVVRECADVCQKVTDSGMFDGNQQYASAYCRDEIKQHFGIK